MAPMRDRPFGVRTAPVVARRAKVLASGFGPRMKRDALPLAVLLLLAAFTLAGCQSSGGSGGHASLRITGHEVEEIRLATKDVFNQAGYGLTVSQPESMTFQRLGTLGDAVLYGGWGDDHVTTRVRVRFESTSSRDWTLVATVYTVRDPGDRVLEEENRKWVVNRGPYQRLLEDVKARLDQPPAAAAP